MSNLTGKYARHVFHGAPERFEVVADYIYQAFGKSVNYIADVAGGSGMLTRILNKKYNYKAEVIDPRGWTLRGVPNQENDYEASMASYYDLVVGLHPDSATRAVVESALTKPTIIIPCCNFWDKSKKLGREALLLEISKYYDENGIGWKRVEFGFKSTKNIGLVSNPANP